MKPTLTDTESQLLSRLHDARVALGRGGIDTAKAELNAAQEAADKALNEAAELRAAVREWADAKQAFDDAERAWTNVIDAREDVEEHKATWTRALQREQAAEAVLRRLGSLPSDKEQA